ncbi:alpha/beta-hydrolase [Hypoxylon trugodes]|uniref:alpha/beta-hydrolase n=1 Tax=Hypoxylon trugodes TaxID=326681 RepID=UPI00219EAE1C|nr:alpha/beta-hydrolase [Hypoxylon trugodes]KAI1382941.1 alpha/beta-hydrolase [Hypoxylon trugodes]
MDFSEWGQPSKEWLAFATANPTLLSRSDEHLPPLKQQENANTLRTNVAKTLVQTTGLGHLVHTEDYVVPTRDGQSIILRSYRPVLLGTQTLPGYVYFHGGGFVFGGLDTELFNCSWMAHALSITVVHVCYRHTPQFTGLTAWHDAVDGFEWVTAHTNTLSIDPSQLVIGGLSAGASLTAHVVQNELKRVRETGATCRIRGQVLGMPTLVQYEAFPYHLFADREKTSVVQCADAAIISMKRVKGFSHLLGRDIDPADPTWSPALADEKDLRGMPPTAILVTGWDPLRDEGLWYAQKLKNAGVRTRVHIFPGLPHAFNAFMQLPSHKRWGDVLLECIRWASAGEDGWVVEKPAVMTSLMERVTAGASSSAAVKTDSPSDVAAQAGTSL